MKVGFSILHYNNIEVTCQAVYFLKRLICDEPFEIIIVDNNSPNGSGNILQHRYNNENHVHIILNETNIGFAGGNNIGYIYAKEKLLCDIIVVMNSDIYIRDEYFLLKLQKITENCHFEIIAPNIIGLEGEQNPFRLQPLSEATIKKMYLYNSIIHVIYYIPIINKLLATILDKRKVKNKKSTTISTECVPHGACVIYMKDWIHKEDIAFVPGTFMYLEEDILAVYMKQKRYRAIYQNSLKVYHVEDASVKYNNKDSVRRRKFISGCMKKSLEFLIKFKKYVYTKS